ncbi:DUF3472 domain-containing protein [Lysobacter sp. CA196]|uniref:DUF3472 domain-containing protein n=1 Tax=Lysobacter sp. CA196 TaxID=3455606 RepID=UPI003F8D75ED
MSYRFRPFFASVLTMLILAAPSVAAIETTPAGGFELAADNLDSVEYRFRIDEDPGDSSFIFWAQQFWINGGAGGYLGLQRDAHAEPYKKKVIFSIWDTLASRKGNIPGTKAQPFGGEGVGQQVIAPLDWKIGHTYAFTLRLLADRWWSVHIADETTGQQWDLGGIQARPSWQRLQPYVSTFTEVYLRNQACEEIPYARASFLPPVGNYGDVVDLPSKRSAYTYGSYGMCDTAQAPGARPGENVGVSARSDASGTLVHEIGLSNRPQRESSWYLYRNTLVSVDTVSGQTKCITPRSNPTGCYQVARTDRDYLRQLVSDASSTGNTLTCGSPNYVKTWGAVPSYPHHWCNAFSIERKALQAL